MKLLVDDEYQSNLCIASTILYWLSASIVNALHFANIGDGTFYSETHRLLSRAFSHIKKIVVLNSAPIKNNKILNNVRKYCLLIPKEKSPVVGLVC